MKNFSKRVEPSATTTISSSNKQDSGLSLADELIKLSKLKEQGIISEEEFQKMKQDVMKRLQ